MQEVIAIIQVEFLPRYSLISKLVCLSIHTAVGRYVDLLY
jgi:hypothetical protein